MRHEIIPRWRVLENLNVAQLAPVLPTASHLVSPDSDHSKPQLHSSQYPNKRDNLGDLVADGEIKIYLQAFLNSALDVGQWWASRTIAFLMSKPPRYVTDKRLRESHSWCVCCGEDRNNGCRQSNTGCPAFSLVTVFLAPRWKKLKTELKE